MLIRKGQKERKDEVEGVSSYWMNIRKTGDTGI
jgi:hypothetical protein